MQYPTSDHEARMLSSIVLSLSEEAARFGHADGRFHGFEFHAMRLARRRRGPRRLRVEVWQEGRLVQDFELAEPFSVMGVVS